MRPHPPPPPSAHSRRPNSASVVSIGQATLKASAKYGGRFKGLFWLFGLFLAVLLFKLFTLQVLEAPTLKQKAKRLHAVVGGLNSRGKIVDRNGVVLAQDTVLYDLYAHPAYFRDQHPEQLAQALAPVLHQSPAVLTRLLKQPYPTLSVAKNLSQTQREAIGKLRLTLPQLDEKTGLPTLDNEGRPLTKRVALNGLDPVKKAVRRYPQGRLASHLLGFSNPFAGVSSGVESSVSDWLEAEDAAIKGFEADALGNPLTPSAEAIEALMQVNHGQDVKLTLDSRLQFIAEKALAEGLQKTKAQRGTVLMMVPQTGEVLAFAVLPDFEPERYFKASPEALKNWAITDVYPPGSTMKILTLACGLESGVITPQSHIMDTGRIKLHGWPITNYDYSKRPHPGNISLVDLLVHSSNVASAKIAMQIPKATYFRLLKGFGFGQKTGMDVPGESSGLFFSKPSWSELDQATFGYGYGLASTPLQMASAVGAIANGGVWVPPHLISTASRQAFEAQLKTNLPASTSSSLEADLDRQASHQSQRKKAPPVQHRVLSAKTAAQVTQLLSQSIAANQKSPAYLGPVAVAGKTGTSLKPGKNGYSKELFTSFVGYFPANAPKVLVMVVIDSPKIGEAWGSTVAAPIFRQIALETIHYYGLK